MLKYEQIDFFEHSRPTNLTKEQYKLYNDVCELARRAIDSHITLTRIDSADIKVNILEVLNGKRSYNRPRPCVEADKNIDWYNIYHS